MWANLCNFSCVHCIRDEAGPKHHLPLALIDKVLREVQPYHMVTYVALTGGEPTLHPQFADIVHLVTSHGYPFGFVTNGWNFSHTFDLLRPVKEWIGQITLSLDGASEITHDALRRRPGSFRRVMQAISLCTFHGIPVHINMVVTQANRTELEAMALLASRLGCAALGYGHCQPTPDAIAAGLVLNAQERRQVEADIAALQQIMQMPIVLAGDHYSPSLFAQCPQLRMQEFNIDYRGYLTACCTLSNYRGGTPDTDIIADLHRVSFADAHKRLIATIAALNMAKIDRLRDQDTSEADHFICTHCLVHYQKVPQLAHLLVPTTEHSPQPEGAEPC
jgi:MoaA/NifB/PqqE/SkfB family radical SAM enzyme